MDDSLTPSTTTMTNEVRHIFHQILVENRKLEKPITSLHLKLAARKLLGATHSITQAMASHFIKHAFAQQFDTYFGPGWIATIPHGQTYFVYMKDSWHSDPENHKKWLAEVHLT